MKKTLLSLTAALAAFTLCADHTEFFDAGDFDTKAPYGSGANGISVGGNSTKTWNEKEGTVKIALKPGKSGAIALFRLNGTTRLICSLDITIRAKMRGMGKVRFEFSENPKSKAHSRTVTLTEKWQDLTLQLPSTEGDATLLILRLMGENAWVELDRLSVQSCHDETLIQAPVGALVVKPKSTVPPQIFTAAPMDVKGKFCRHDEVGDKHLETPAETLAGKVAYPAFTAAADGHHRIVFTTGGSNAVRDVIVAPAAEVDALNAAAKKVDLKGKPMRILYLADSLTDYNRHRNHPAILTGLLAQYNPGKVMFHNAACGGDQNVRIAARLADRGVYRGYMYDELWKRKYDVIILFLGQNDTVAFKESNYTKPQFSIAKVDSAMRTIIAAVKKHNPGARIIITSGVSTPVSKNPAYHFGVPELVEAYNECAAKVAKETGAEYLDYYTPMKAIPEEEKVKLFVADRVHLSPAGHRYIALKTLEYLGR